MTATVTDDGARWYAWGYSYGRRVQAGTLTPRAWVTADGSPIDWRTSDKAFPRGYRDALTAPRPGANRTCVHCGERVTLEMTGAWRLPFYNPCLPGHTHAPNLEDNR